MIKYSLLILFLSFWQNFAPNNKNTLMGLYQISFKRKLSQLWQMFHHMEFRVGHCNLRKY